MATLLPSFVLYIIYVTITVVLYNMYYSVQITTDHERTISAGTHVLLFTLLPSFVLYIIYVTITVVLYNMYYSVQMTTNHERTISAGTHVLLFTNNYRPHTDNNEHLRAPANGPISDVDTHRIPGKLNQSESTTVQNHVQR
jgi:phosphotransferase system  glucose/maltose/N-acetylglucosamine-specific IIC component